MVQGRFLRTNYRKGGYIYRGIQTITQDSASGFMIFSYGGFKLLGDADIAVEVIPYDGDMLGRTTILQFIRNVSFNHASGIFAVSVFFSGTSLGTLAATQSGQFIIEALIGSR